jgi:predicted nucleic acid-binding protein
MDDDDGVETSFGRIVPSHFAPHDGTVRHQVFLGPKFLYALFNSGDDLHTLSATFIEYVRTGAIPYRRLLVNEHALDEAATRLKRKATMRQAARLLTAVEESEYLRLERVPDDTFDDARTRFVEWDDYTASFTDFVVVEHMNTLDIDHLATYDSDFDAFDIMTLPYLSVR